MVAAYTYRASLVRLLDADTAELAIDLGFHVSVRVVVRIEGVYAPEGRTDEGKLATAKMGRLFREATSIHVRTRKAEPLMSFSRYVAQVYLGDVDVAELWHGVHAEPRSGIGVRR